MTYGLHKVDICYIARDTQNVSQSRNSKSNKWKQSSGEVKMGTIISICPKLQKSYMWSKVSVCGQSI